MADKKDKTNAYYAGKTLIRIKGRVNESPYYDPKSRNPSIRFAMVSKPLTLTEKGEEITIRRQATPFYTCRDFINDTLRACVHEQTDSGKYSDEVDLTKLRLLIGRDCKNREDRYAFKAKLFSAKRLLNFYEKVAGWEKTSVMTTVRLEEGTARNSWLLTGPQEWLKYSHLTSMITLLFRVVANYGPINFTNIDDIEEWFAKIIKQYDDDKTSGVSRMDWDLENYLRTSYQKFYMMMKYFDKIFIDPLEDAYPEEGSVHASGGIYQLCMFASGCSGLDKRMKETWKEYQSERQERLMKRAESVYKKETGAPSL